MSKINPVTYRDPYRHDLTVTFVCAELTRIACLAYFGLESAILADNAQVDCQPPDQFGTLHF